MAATRRLLPGSHGRPARRRPLPWRLRGSGTERVPEALEAGRRGRAGGVTDLPDRSSRGLRSGLVTAAAGSTWRLDGAWVVKQSAVLLETRHVRGLSGRCASAGAAVKCVRGLYGRMWFWASARSAHARGRPVNRERGPQRVHRAGTARTSPPGRRPPAPRSPYDSSGRPASPARLHSATLPRTRHCV